MNSKQLFLAVFVFIVFSPPTFWLSGVINPSSFLIPRITLPLIILVPIGSAFFIGRRFGKPALLAPTISILPIVMYQLAEIPIIVHFNQHIDVDAFAVAVPFDLLFCGLLVFLTFVGAKSKKKAQTD